MKKTEVPKIELPNGKTHISIEMFTKMLRDIAIKDEVSIEIEREEQILIIHAYAYGFCVEADIPISVIINKVFDFKRMKILTEEVYESLKTYLVQEAEYIENTQKEESEFDEHWEFLELWCM